VPTIAAIAFAASIALPPPNPMTTLHSAERARSIPSRTRSTVGSPDTANRS